MQKGKTSLQDNSGVFVAIGSSLISRNSEDFVLKRNLGKVSTDRDFMLPLAERVLKRAGAADKKKEPVKKIDKATEREFTQLV